MRKSFAVSLIAFLALTFYPQISGAASDEFSTGKDWVEKMNVREKLISLYAPHLLLKKYGVPINDSAIQYMQRIDRVLLYNPYMENEDVANLFASTVYAYEPGSRDAIRSMIRIFEYRKTGDPSLLDPAYLLRSASASDMGPLPDKK